MNTVKAYMDHLSDSFLFTECKCWDVKGKIAPVAREINFIAHSGGKKTYIQSAYALGTEETAFTEQLLFSLTGDSFPKIIVRHDIRKRWYDESGILHIGLMDFLLDDTLI